MHLQSIENEFDCHLMAHHTIFMGDLNYRLTALDATPDRILHMITDVINNNFRTTSYKRGQVFSHNQLLTPVRSEGSPAPIADAFSNDMDDTYMLTQSPSVLEAAAAAASTSSLPSRHHRHHHVAVLSPLSSVSTAPSAVEVSWRSLLEHDELKASMDDGTIFHDFDEASIAFPPTYRRVLGQALDARWTASPLTPARVASVYTTVLGDGRIRVPSYTDRILFHSLPGLRDRFACVQYSSAEFIGTSDHKPVSCGFQVYIDKTRQSSCTHPAAVPSSASHDVAPTGFGGGPAPLTTHMTVYLSSLTIHLGPALEKFNTSDGEEGDSSDIMCATPAPRLPTGSIASSDVSGASISTASDVAKSVGMSIVDGMQVRSVFPLPCEDEFAEERKLGELADQLVFHANKQRKFKSTTKHSAWASVAVHGLKQSVVLTPRKLLHVALNFILPSGTTVGQCVISLTEASYRNGRKVDFVAALTVGGRRTGELLGKVSLSVQKR
ncbi:hypothetical protein DYB28_007850 [Aphanomyces astaci]|uniref:Inositol polyphosphate-related phosphatase domain-containing protein n=4 Tax=Aphanomyces astaci TaxID=112090 RepID=A0A397EAB5_APHAT|nr:hypothetical protein DYB38_003566 [Aphanomyces astaci]RLO13335.1 hypothetical protein DYB28_007850 [Aphanomyces astaci]